MACSSCAKKAALRNARVVNRSLNATKKVRQRLESKINNQKTKPKTNEQ